MRPKLQQDAERQYGLVTHTTVQYACSLLYMYGSVLSASSIHQCSYLRPHLLPTTQCVSCQDSCAFLFKMVFSRMACFVSLVSSACFVCCVLQGSLRRPCCLCCIQPAASQCVCRLLWWHGGVAWGVPAWKRAHSMRIRPSHTPVCISGLLPWFCFCIALKVRHMCIQCRVNG